MTGLHSQSRRKAERRSVDMSAAMAEDAVTPAWQRPPPEECAEEDVLTLSPPGADPKGHRMKVRIVSHAGTHVIVEFAVIQQAYDRGKWRDVVALDSCHDTEVHLHRYARSSDSRIGEPELLLDVACEDDVQTGYNLAYDLIEQAWSENYQRWQMRDMDRATITRMIFLKLADPEFRRRLSARAGDGTRPVLVGLRSDQLSEIIAQVVALGGAANLAVPWLNGIAVFEIVVDKGRRQRRSEKGHLGECSLGVFLERLRADGGDEEKSTYGFTFDGASQARAELVAIAG